MPDWVTHIIIALLFAEAFGIRKKSIVLLGSILPDILPKLVLLKLMLPIPDWNYVGLGAMHTPFVFFLFTMVIAPLFRERFWCIIFWLNLGAVSHFAADALLRHFAAGVHLLYPISLKHYTLNLVWPDDSLLILIPALIMYMGLIWWRNKE